MKKSTIIHHQGFGDLITSNSICNYYSEMYDELVVFVLDEARKKVVSEMYKHKPNIKCVVPKFIDNNLYNSSCIICMADGYPCRPDSRFDGHKYIDYSDWLDFDNIKIGCFKEDYKKWEKFLYDNMDNNISFSHSFYLYENLDLNVRTDFFSVYRNDEKESDMLSKINSNEYIVIHDDNNRSLLIDGNRLPKNYLVYQLNGVSGNMVDQIKILENAKEIHFIDSNYSVMIYFLSFINDKIKKIPKYLHYYARKNKMIYEKPTPENWFVLE
jgi:hypothetical protein